VTTDAGLSTAPPGRPTSPPAGACPACGHGELRFLFEQQAPLHTSTLLDDRDAALAYPRGTIRLEVCLGCGFMTNTAFDAPGHDYSASYEETQAFSGRFVEWSRGLAQSLTDRHALRGKPVLEIGCGRGDFLRLLCDATGSTGVGIDPSLKDEHVAAAGPELELRRAYFTPEQIDAEVGLVVCRHTLEHVHDVNGFLRMLHAGLAGRPATPVFFEVPDTARILRECAFWDVFYEHCSYFTPGSLVRAFRLAGFTPTALELGFDDQYILLDAAIVPLRSPAASVEAASEPPEETVAAAERFAASVGRTRDEWRDRLRTSRSEGRKTVIWGGGSKGVGFLAALGLGEEIECAVDINPAKQGMFMPGTGHEIVAPDRLSALAPDLVIVLNPAYEAEIRRDLVSLGLEPEVALV
jgi:SAM-dependent methyltransferase